MQIFITSIFQCQRKAAAPRGANFKPLNCIWGLSFAVRSLVSCLPRYRVAPRGPIMDGANQSEAEPHFAELLQGNGLPNALMGINLIEERPMPVAISNRDLILRSGIDSS